jgi:hypothetical protein
VWLGFHNPNGNLRHDRAQIGLTGAAEHTGAADRTKGAQRARAAGMDRKHH